MWNCKSSIFLFSFREFKKPALRFEKAESSGARIVSPPLFPVMSCEFMLLMISVVFRRRVRMLNVLAFLRILVMSSGVESEVSGESGSVGTKGFVDVGDAAFGARACFGDAAGPVAAILGEYNDDNMSRNSEKEKRICFMFSLVEELK
ncbi:hypothetical protein KIW84_057691 [Lathyrus oleraceus]|uniref:Uncharacterized protein n=1 Tax=Pisum sativum TaxID=3888 RepID=A0A9D4X3X9_PEA|nr:hypothetical protein KIW84_057691 [Pisum sativum]